MGKKAVVVGGSNGIGLAIVNKLINEKYFVYIIDRNMPDEQSLIEKEKSEFVFCDLLDFNAEVYEELSKDEEINLLMITAGFGRISDFENFSVIEIDQMMKVNLLASIKILKCFYHRIKDEKTFYCGIMGSIAGLVSSPMFALYAATKAGVCRFVESVNIELEYAGLKNRILNISPGSIKGTKFNGGENDLNLLMDLANEITNQLFESKELYIPQYEEVYKNVLKNYKEDAHKFGMNSYEYKMKSGRVGTESKVKIGYLSGTFDLFHIGHLNLIKRAKQKCDYLIVGVHKDASHKNKETFINFEERLEIVASCKYVDKAVVSCKEDSDAWDLWKYNCLFVGDDYKNSERFKKYEEYFKTKNVEIIYFPYTKSTSSTKIRNVIAKEDTKE